MHIDFTVVLKTLTGAPLIDGGKPLTLAVVASGALLNNYKDEKLSGDDKAKRFVLATKIYGKDDGLPVELAVEDVAMLKNLIGKTYSVLIVGQAYAMLEGNTPAAAPKANGHAEAPEAPAP